MMQLGEIALESAAKTTANVRHAEEWYRKAAGGDPPQPDGLFQIARIRHEVGACAARACGKRPIPRGAPLGKIGVCCSRLCVCNMARRTSRTGTHRLTRVHRVGLRFSLGLDTIVCTRFPAADDTTPKRCSDKKSVSAAASLGAAHSGGLDRPPCDRLPAERDIFPRAA